MYDSRNIHWKQQREKMGTVDNSEIDKDDDGDIGIQG